MLKPLQLLPICLLLVAQACHRPEGISFSRDSTPAAADSLKIEALITRGKKLRNTNVDSLPGIAWELESISRFRDQKYGLLYAGILKSYYYWLSTDYANGMKVSLETLKNADQWQIAKVKPEIYAVMANMHKENANYQAAFSDCMHGLAIARQLKDTASVISLLGLKAMFTHSYYNKKNRQQDDHTSLQMEFEALQMAEANPKYETMRIRFYDNIAQTFKERKDYAQAIAYAQKGIDLAKKHQQQRSLTYSYNWLGEAYYYAGQREKGIVYLDSAIMFSRNANLPYRQMEINEAKYQCYLAVADYQPAIASLQRYTQMRDSLQIAKNEQKISELQLKYQSKEKDQQIAVLGDQNNSNNRRIFWVLAGMLFIMTMLIVIMRQYLTIRKYSRVIKADNDQMNKALMKIAHVQAHEVRGPLTSILGLINIIKDNDYEADKEELEKMETAANQLDTRIRKVVAEAELAD